MHTYMCVSGGAVRNVSFYRKILLAWLMNEPYPKYKKNCHGEWSCFVIFIYNLCNSFCFFTNLISIVGWDLFVIIQIFKKVYKYFILKCFFCECAKFRASRAIVPSCLRGYFVVPKFPKSLVWNFFSWVFCEELVNREYLSE